MSFAISQHFLDDRGQRAGFVLLGSFLASFLFIRTSARLIRNPKITLIVLGIAPFDLSNRTSPISSLVAVIVIDLVFSTLAILKGKPILGLLGVFVPLMSIVGTVRLGAPRSPWARWRYPPEGRRMVRSQARFKRVRSRRRRFMNAIGGAPSQPADGGA